MAMKVEAKSPTTMAVPDPLCLIHKGAYAKVIKSFLPRVETFTLSSGWDDDKVTAFSEAIKQVVVENPILTSHLLWKKKALYASPGSYTTENHSFVKIEDEQTIDVTDFADHKTRADFINDRLAPKVGDRTKVMSSDDLKGKRPLFYAHLFLFANGHACYYVGVSHALADGKTYYQIIDQISSFMNHGKIMTKINWGNPELTGLETYPDHYTKRDVKRSGMLPLILGFLRSGKRDKEQIWILDSEEISQLKKDQVDPETNEYLSSHDIIISTICKLVQSSDEVSIVMDYRERHSSFSESDGGNCLKQWTMPFDAGRDPNTVRQAINKGYYHEGNQVDGKAIRKGRLCYTTSWVTNHKSIEEVNTICHLPSTHFVRSIPADTGIIFRIDDTKLGLMHNFREVDSAELAKTKWIEV